MTYHPFDYYENNDKNIVTKVIYYFRSNYICEISRFFISKQTSYFPLRFLD